MLKKRKAIKIVLHIILAILVVVGLAIGSWYFIIWGVGTSISSCMDFFSETEPEEKTSGDFVYHIMSRGVEYDHEVIAIVGLSEEGKTKKEILIPQRINGLPVEFLGYKYG